MVEPKDGGQRRFRLGEALGGLKGLPSSAPPQSPTEPHPPDMPSANSAPAADNAPDDAQVSTSLHPTSADTDPFDADTLELDSLDPNLIQVLMQQQKRRIRDLEQALDQSLVSLKELRSQLVDQNFLERQLASTEEIANVQQQAIHQLKLQFAQQKATLEARVQAQALDPIQSQIQSPIQSPIQAQPEPQAAREPIASLPSRFDTDLQQQIQVLQADMDLRRQQVQTIAAQKLQAQTRLSELEKQLEDSEGQNAKQLATQALLQQACQELELDREHSQHRIAELERQAAEMQEQILSQAQQASEYETAVQHWKNRVQSLHGAVTKLGKVLKAHPTGSTPTTEPADTLPTEAVELLAILEAATSPDTQPVSRVHPFSPDPRVDVPEFLTRRRTYRRNQNQNQDQSQS